MASKFTVNDIVIYCYGDNQKYSYEIISSDANARLINSQFVFGYDSQGNPMNSYFGKFDFILAEYNRSKNFIRNIACLKEEVSKEGNFIIEENKSTKL